jgi:hypothetical protein
VAGLHDTGFGEGEAWAITDQVRVLLALPRPSAMRGPAKQVPARLLEAWLGIEPIRVALGVNTWEDVEYLDGYRFNELLDWALRLDAIDATGPRAAAIVAASSRVVGRLAAAAEAVGYRTDRLRERLAGSVAAAPRRRAGPTTAKPAARSLSEQDPAQGRRRG